MISGQSGDRPEQLSGTHGPHRSGASQIGRNFAGLASAATITNVSGLVITALLARRLGPHSFGDLTIAYAVSAYGLLIVDSGLSLFGAREIAKNPNGAGRTVSDIVTFRLLAAVLVMVFLVLGLVISRASWTLSLLLLGTFAWSLPFAMTIDWAFQGLQRPALLAAGAALSAVIYTLLVAISVRGPNDLVNAPLSRGVAGLVAAVGMLVVFSILRKSFRWYKPTIENWTVLWRAAVTLGLAYLFVQVYVNLDAIILRLFAPAEVVGWYGAAAKLFLGFLGLVGLTQSAAFPMLANVFTSDTTRALAAVTRYVSFVLPATGMVLTIVLVEAPQIVWLAFGPGYEASALALRLLSPSVLAVAASGALGILTLMASGRNRAMLVGVACGAFANIALNFALIPHYGLVGVSLANLFAQLFIAVVMYRLAQAVGHVEVIAPIARTCVAVILTVALCIPAASWIGANLWAGFHLVIASAVTSVVYVIATATVGDRKVLRHAMDRTRYFIARADRV